MSSGRAAAHLTETAQEIAALVGAPGARFERRLQSLWGGYGEIWRVAIEGSSQTEGSTPTSVIVKRVAPPSGERGRSHERKLRSYDVERTWYRTYASECDSECRGPSALHCSASRNRWLFVLEDLDAAGFTGRRSHLTDSELTSCLRWLAHFHAQFLGRQPAGLWQVGSYWHLATRPDELSVLADARLREAAPLLDAKLKTARHQTFVHGDAKVENFCFGRDSVAALDFQYVGGGPGIKDVVYFLSSCLSPRQCESSAERHLATYFRELQGALQKRRPDVDAHDVEQEWRELYPVAWADFFRFLLGWAPGSYDRDAYSQKLTARALRALAGS